VVEGPVLHHQDDDMVNLLQIDNIRFRAHSAAPLRRSLISDR
jgi:hypothetical protein